MNKRHRKLKSSSHLRCLSVRPYPGTLVTLLGFGR